MFFESFATEFFYFCKLSTCCMTASEIKAGRDEHAHDRSPQTESGPSKTTDGPPDRDEGLRQVRPFRRVAGTRRSPVPTVGCSAPMRIRPPSDHPFHK
ncbi:unnamed protein product [Nesidiocoris tenuis]|uniref:Uncharacterized protein n=1 Tax=Nesidiocoris tenuis TaxID=355587 RepID=A0A6H5H673_9HEMI|nr:unnamed protein product [Nesidiocoris tenuis]